MTWMVEIDPVREDIKLQIEKLKGGKGLLTWLQLIILEYKLKKTPEKKTSMSIPKC